MKKIIKLTTEQESSIPEFRQKWIALGESTARSDPSEMIDAVNDLYDSIGQKRVPVFVMDSPLGCIVAANLFKAGIGANIRDNIRDNIDDNIGDNIEENIWDNIGDNIQENNQEKIGVNIRDNIGDNIRESIWAKISGAIVNNIWDNIGDNIHDNIHDNIQVNIQENIWNNIRNNIEENIQVNIWDNIDDNIQGSIWDNIGDNIRGNIVTDIQDNLVTNIGTNLWANVSDGIRDNIVKNIAGDIEENIKENIKENIQHDIRELSLAYENATLWGNHDIGWIAYASFFETIGHRYPAALEIKLKAQRRYHETCGWLYCFDGMAFVSQRPSVVKLDDNARLHCETGTSIKYADGYGFCAWHGTRIPDGWVDGKKSLDVKTAITWANIEQRRAAIEILGWAKILKELDAKVIDADSDPLIGTLVEVKLPNLRNPARFLRVKCGTGREFAIGVPREIKTAIQGQAWMNGLSLSEFTCPEVRT